LIEPASATLLQLPELQTWTEKFLMTPRNEEQYGRAETAFFNAGFYVVAMGGRGLRQIGEIINGAPPPDLDHYARSAPTIVAEYPDELWSEWTFPGPAAVARLVDELRSSLGRGTFYWLGSCAAFPILMPALTDYLGAVLFDDHGHAVGSERGYIQLSVLPWCREGTMPDWLRVTLLNAMPTDFRDQIRHALVRILQQIESADRAEDRHAVSNELLKI
jgi:hypothetical protein